MSLRYALEDIKRLVEGNHDVAALSDPTKVTIQEEWVGIVRLSHDNLNLALTGLKLKTRMNVQEMQETEHARTVVGPLKRHALGQYKYVVDQVRGQWLSDDPENPINPDVLELRHKLVARTLNFHVSALEMLSPGRLAEILAGVGKTMADDKQGIATLNLHERLLSAIPKLEAAAQKIKDERDNDKAATQALNEARATFDREARAHRLLLESLLVRLKRTKELGRFILAEDPAYKARRAAGRPISEEDGLSDIVQEPLTAENPQDGDEA